MNDEKLSNVVFNDDLSGAFCRLEETRESEDCVMYHVAYRLAGEKVGVEAGVWPGSEYDKAWKAFRRALAKVLESVEDWDRQ